MTELEQLQQQVEELKKTVDDLKSGTVKIVPLKDRLSQEQVSIFNRYFESKFDMSDEYWERGEYQKAGYVIAHEKRDQCRTAIRELTKSLYIMNNYSDYKNFSCLRIDKMLKSEEQIQEFLQLFESLCKSVVAELKNDKFKVKEGVTSAKDSV